MPPRSYALQNAFPRRPDFSYRTYGGDARRRTEQAAGLRRLAELLDARFRLPGGFRVGWDGILGLIPGVGDFATSIVSLYIIAQAAMLGAPSSVLARMGLNVVIDSAFGAIPLLGNLFDFVWKSNLKNMRLLDRYLENPERVANRSRWAVGFTVVAVAGLALLTITLAVVAVIGIGRWLFQQAGW